MGLIKRTIHFFDRLEDHVRERLSRHPIVYSFIGGVAVVLFWRGVWMTADEFEFLDGPTSVILSSSILLMTGLFASFFVGDTIIISGLKKEKKLAEKTETEVEGEIGTLTEVKAELHKIEDTLNQIQAEEHLIREKQKTEKN